MRSTLFCLPHAGGTASAFERLRPLLGPDVTLQTLELPGRGARGRDRPCGGFRDAVYDVARQMGEPAGRWALLGHSMGALLAYESVRFREREGLSPPTRLLLSGCAAPQRHGSPTAELDLSEAQLREWLLDLGGVPDDVVADADALSYFSSLVRADGELLAGYRHRQAPTPLSCPVDLLLGSSDPLTNGDAHGEWTRAAGRTVSLHVVDGAGHFFPTERPHETARLINKILVGRERGRDDNRDRYLDVLKKILTNVIYQDRPLPSGWSPGTAYDELDRSTGLDWPSSAHTMVGLRRLENVQDCVESVLEDGVPGDLAETGVWRGGTSIFMRAILQAWGDEERVVWAADSFQGMPEVTGGGHAGDIALGTHRFNEVMGVPLEVVMSNFETYGLLDDQVRFLPGWFKDTLPVAPIERLAVLRLDGDLYESTWDALTSLYPRLSPGGFVIVDDYIIDVCRKAVHDFRDLHAIREPIRDIDGVGAYWRREP